MRILRLTAEITRQVGVRNNYIRGNLQIRNMWKKMQENIALHWEYSEKQRSFCKGIW